MDLSATLAAPELGRLGFLPEHDRANGDSAGIVAPILVAVGLGQRVIGTDFTERCLLSLRAREARSDPGSASHQVLASRVVTHWIFMKTRTMMTSRLALCLTVGLAALAPSWAAAKPAAPSYVARADGYAVWLPARPKVATRKASVPGVGAVTVRYVSVKAPGVAYAVVPLRIPVSASQSDSAAVLAGIEEGFRASGNGRVISSRNIRLGRNPGREAVISMGQGPRAPVMRGRFFVAPGRTYQVMAITPPGPSAKTQAQIQKVLDSFQILK